MDKNKLPMRIGVGIIVLNDKNEVFVGKRKDNPGDKWQMPQGGVDKGEDFIKSGMTLITDIDSDRYLNKNKNVSS